MKIELYPLEKVVINGASIHLGMAQPEVERLIGKGQFVRDRYYHFNNELAVSYGNNDKVNFMEFLGGADGQLKPIIYGISVFDADASEVYEVLKQYNGNDIVDGERGYSYTFTNISVAIYREEVPESVAKMIEEAASFGNPLTAEEREYETKKAEHWATIGVGVPGYYRR